MWSWVVERRRPTRAGRVVAAIGETLPFSALDAIFLPMWRARVDDSASERVRRMDNEIATDTEMVTETLVEEVSIDGMCGVY